MKMPMDPVSSSMSMADWPMLQATAMASQRLIFFVSIDIQTRKNVPSSLRLVETPTLTEA